MLVRIGGIAILIAAGTACGIFGSDTEEVYVDAEAEGLADAEKSDAPTCRPKSATTRGELPYSVGDTTTSGWTVTAIDDEHLEYIRVAFEKGEDSTELEFAFNDDGAGDWATDRYRLMPAPEAEPPEPLLEDAIDHLRNFAAAHPDDPFVRRTEGVEDPYEGLPPCPE